MDDSYGAPLVSVAVELDGLSLARRIRVELKSRVDSLRDKGVAPKLDVVVASQDPSSLAYVAMKRKWAQLVGIAGDAFEVTESTTQEDVLRLIERLNDDANVHGVLIQHPLPPHLDEPAILEALGHVKDVDGLTPQSLGRLISGLDGFRCATPLGMMRILDEYGIGCEGKRAVVIGRSVILGKPAALMLLERNATVTIAHSRTKDLPELCREADILVAAVGRPEFVQGHWIKPGAAVLDAGYNRVEGNEKDVGDVDFAAASSVAGWITPVPGGIGPMTVASLLSNCVDAAERTVSV